jgi:hypothetical protein
LYQKEDSSERERVRRRILREEPEKLRKLRNRR